ncbi:hypothetical protein C8J57DRAFT_1220661 [Mycena rebaudengoi]|nr:hypothetical protein C8J57DRAFT_1220661 [Mycena rebaudengoi]
MCQKRDSNDRPVSLNDSSSYERLATGLIPPVDEVFNRLWVVATRNSVERWACHDIQMGLDLMGVLAIDSARLEFDRILLASPARRRCKWERRCSHNVGQGGARRHRRGHEDRGVGCKGGC